MEEKFSSKFLFFISLSKKPNVYFHAIVTAREWVIKADNGMDLREEWWQHAKDDFDVHVSQHCFRNKMQCYFSSKFIKSKFFYGYKSEYAMHVVTK